ncbi:MAG: ABC transporter ATP-binding protein [Chloroflexi bacterium]|nr:ABC transporter ATP-binding protein [Chloroflexota bacterium]
MKLLLRLLGYARPHWRLVGIIVASMTTESVMRTVPAWLTKLIIDEAAVYGSVQSVVGLTAGLFLVTAVARALNSLQNYSTESLGQNVVHDLRNDLYRHLQSQSMSFYDAHQTGQLMSRVTSDVSQVQFFASNGIIRILDATFGILVYIGVMMALDVQLTLIALSATPIIILVQLRIRTITAIYRELQRMMARLTGILQENVAAIKLVKAYNREQYESDRFLSEYWRIRTRRLWVTRKMGAWSQVQEVSTAFASVLVLYFGAQRVMDGTLTIGGLFAFQAYVLMLWQPVRFFGFINQAVQQALAAGERVFEIVDWPLDVAEKPDAVPLPPLEGDLVIDRASFAYGRQAPLLRDITIHVRPGSSLAIVGPSGSGKTTLINLIPRFYDVTRGRVVIDGHDVREVTLASLRSQIGMVLQETFLFNMTIRENIRYGRDDATDEQVIEAAKAANAHDFIAEFPEGYDTMIGERGVRLSGGQRQRLAIARALLVDPRILILDEATSSVDTRTDFLIQRALERLMEGRTTIVIAHRLSTVQRAGQIVYMENGRIVGRGSHTELLETCPQYRHLYETQFRKQETAGVPLTPGPSPTRGEGSTGALTLALSLRERGLSSEVRSAP